MKAREILAAGCQYIGLGWQAFILSPTKSPVANCDRCTAEHVSPQQMEDCRCLCCHGFYAGTLDPERLKAMTDQHPRGLLAIRTGAPSGIAVADVDRRGILAMRTLVDDGLLPRTVAAETGGGGYHFLYAHPGVKVRSGANKIADGIDSKSDGAYIVASPSIHPRTRRPYRWLTRVTVPLTPLPQHLVDQLREPERTPRPDSAVRVAGGRGSRYAEAALQKELEKLLALRGAEGVRNDVLAKQSAFSLGQLVAGGALDRDRTAALLQEAGERIGLEPGETRRAIASGFRAGALCPRGGA